MKSCQEVMELMQRDLDRDLTENEKNIMIEHLQQCPDCTAMYERLTQISDELEQLPKVTPPYSIVDALMPQLEQIDRQGKSQFSRFWQRTSFKIAAGVIAAGIILGLSLPALMNHSRNYASSGVSGTTNAASSASSSSGKSSSGANRKSSAFGSNSANMEKSQAPLKVQDQYGSSSPSSGPVANHALTTKLASPMAQQPSGSNTQSGAAGKKSAANQMMTQNGIVSQPPLATADGKYTAVVVRQTVVIRDANKKAIYTSSHTWAANDHISFIKWQGDEQLTYKVVTSDTVQQYRIDLQQNTEDKISTSEKTAAAQQTDTGSSGTDAGTK